MRPAEVARELRRAVLTMPTLRTAADLDRLSATMLRSLIGCDEVISTRIDLTTQAATVRRGAELVRDPAMSVALASAAADHPAVTSYLAPDDDGAPRRVSDVVPQRTWLSSAGYNVVFRDCGARFQLSLVVELAASTGAGWVLTRSTRDFSDDDVDIAAILLPQAAALNALAARIRGRPGDGGPPARRDLGLTVRELAVLREAGSGATAHAIGRTLGISEGTVRKHLEHAYAKLGAHDRVSALNALRDRCG